MKEYKTPNGTIDVLAKVEEFSSESGNGKVVIISHSMGGLLGKAIIKRLQEQGKDNLIDSFVMVGSPQLGTPQAIASLLHGDGEGILGGFIVSPVEARAVSQYMPSAYSLLPSSKYFDIVTDPVIHFAEVNFTEPWREYWGNSINTYDPFVEFLTGQGVARTAPHKTTLRVPEILKPEFVNLAADFHNAYDAYVFPEHIRVVQLAGWGRPTVKAVEYKTIHFLRSYGTLFTREGDGTVVYPSAISSAADETYFFNIFKQNQSLNQNTQHRDLLSAASTQDILKLVVKKEDFSTVDFISTIKPVPDELGDEIVISTHSPVILGVHDEFGNFTGIDPNQDLSTEILEVSEGIPGSSFLYTSESQHVFLPKTGTYTLIYKGIGAGLTTVSIENFSADTATPVAQYSDIPTTASTSASFVLASEAAGETVIEIDIDGDGTNDETIQPDGNNLSLNELISFIKEKILALNIEEKLKENLLKEIARLEKKIEKKNGENTKILEKLEQTINKQAEKGKIDSMEADEIIELINEMEVQIEDVKLDGAVLSFLKEMIASLDAEQSLKNQLLKRAEKLEKKQALIKTLGRIANKVSSNAAQGKIQEEDAQVLLDIIEEIERMI